MNQEEFNKFYDKLKRYANQKARRLFYDTSLRQAVVDKAMDKVEDSIIGGKEPDFTFMKSVICYSIRLSHNRRKIEPVNLKGTEFYNNGFRGRKVRE